MLHPRSPVSVSASHFYHQPCISLRARLLLITEIEQYFGLLSETYSSPVAHLWDLFCLGIPLCRIFNLLAPRVQPIELEHCHDIANKHTQTLALALFATNLKQVPRCATFTVADLQNRDSTEGLHKALMAVTTILDMLEQAESPSESRHWSLDFKLSTYTVRDRPSEFTPDSWDDIVHSFLESERNYILDLDQMLRFAGALSQSGALNSETANHVFSPQFFTFQRKFLVRLENTADLPWQDQRWGRHFLENEIDITILYQIYCVNRNIASEEISTAYRQHRLDSNCTVNADNFLTILERPFRRLSIYEEFLRSLISASRSISYQYSEELEFGNSAIRRVHKKVAEAQVEAQPADDTQGAISPRDLGADISQPTIPEPRSSQSLPFPTSTRPGKGKRRLSIKSPNPDTLFVELHFGEDIFVISVPKPIEYQVLMERIEKKIRLCCGMPSDHILIPSHRKEGGPCLPITTQEDLNALLSIEQDGSVVLFVA